MRKILFCLIAFAACDRDRTETRIESRKPVESETVVEVKRIDLEGERSNLSRWVQERTARLEAKIDELEKRGDEKSKELAATLRAKRDQARGKLSELGKSTQETWAGFKRDVQDTWDQLERDVNEATR